MTTRIEGLGRPAKILVTMVQCATCEQFLYHGAPGKFVHAADSTCPGGDWILYDANLDDWLAYLLNETGRSAEASPPAEWRRA